ncbi:helix-turn-helix domain-containing protein [Streptomyces antibioticus]|uniref:helix-turn-helix domain-containing protein n=1 Tax=Streptomyces antibioticus TaxID=1890 RepID=UPI0022569F2C|nr:helix-turn-helix transcriptional regulator [Streptomyces antibioticus]MCX5172183.1 helix-turn-helix transcriptional regulator [Streptomyces antibioticus]
MRAEESTARGTAASTALAHQGLDQLTRREREVLLLLADGLGNRQLARELGIAERTVRAHLASVIQKLGVQSPLQAALVGDRCRSIIRSGIATEEGIADYR